MSALREVAELRFILFKDGQSPSSPAWTSLTTELAARPGVQAVYFGPLLEPSAPATHVLAVHWPGYDAAAAFAADPAAATWHATYAEVVNTPRRAHAVLAADTTKVLASPCTELFTGFGAAPGYLDSVRSFAAKLDAAALEGYHGVAVGEIVEPLAIGPGGEPGQAVLMAIGWDSMEKHLEEKAKAGNPIIANIGLLREGRTAVDMYHVNFQQL